MITVCMQEGNPHTHSHTQHTQHTPHTHFTYIMQHSNNQSYNLCVYAVYAKNLFSRVCSLPLYPLASLSPRLTSFVSFCHRHLVSCPDLTVQPAPVIRFPILFRPQGKVFLTAEESFPDRSGKRFQPQDLGQLTASLSHSNLL